MPTVNEAKAGLRRRFRGIRNSGEKQSHQSIDREITGRLLELDCYKSAQLVLCYVSSGDEVDTLQLIVRALHDGKEVACPRCHTASHTMSFHKISSLNDLSPGAYGIYEPSEDAPAAQPEEMQKSVCIIPGLAFDGNGGRLGYGGGYYDRFLAGYTGISIGLCREETFSADPLPGDEYDVPVNIVVTGSYVVSSCRSSQEQQ